MMDDNPSDTGTGRQHLDIKLSGKRITEAKHLKCMVFGFLPAKCNEDFELYPEGKKEFEEKQINFIKEEGLLGNKKLRKEPVVTFLKEKMGVEQLKGDLFRCDYLFYGADSQVKRDTCNETEFHVIEKFSKLRRKVVSCSGSILSHARKLDAASSPDSPKARSRLVSDADMNDSDTRHVKWSPQWVNEEITKIYQCQTPETLVPLTATGGIAKMCLDHLEKSITRFSEDPGNDGYPSDDLLERFSIQWVQDLMKGSDEAKEIDASGEILWHFLWTMTIHLTENQISLQIGTDKVRKTLGVVVPMKRANVKRLDSDHKNMAVKGMAWVAQRDIDEAIEHPTASNEWIREYSTPTIMPWLVNLIGMASLNLRSDFGHLLAPKKAIWDQQV